MRPALRSSLYFALALALAAAVGCRGASHADAARDPAASPSRPEPTLACKPWNASGFSLVVRNQAGMRADFFREMSFDDATGVLHVTDSDPFATGAETTAPRVIDRSITLSASDHVLLTKRLVAICPAPAAFSEACAPGGCASLLVRSVGAETKLESVSVVTRVFDALEPFFPELRKPK